MDAFANAEDVLLTVLHTKRAELLPLAEKMVSEGDDSIGVPHLFSALKTVLEALEAAQRNADHAMTAASCGWLEE